MLDHLAADGLSAVDALVVSYARPSVRYDVSSIQGMARQLADKLEPTQLVDLVGAVALAIGLVRMTILLESA